MKILAFWFCLLFFIPAFSQIPPTFTIVGHRGVPSLMPENSIPGINKAAELGLDGVEFDVSVSRDKKVVVSHDPYFSFDKKGNPISEEMRKDYRLYDMDYAEIKTFDVGSIRDKSFPDQKTMKLSPPLLLDLLMESQKFIKKNKLEQIFYNVEIKSRPKGDDILHPKPQVFARLVYDEIIKSKMQDYVIIQSFDERILQEFRKFEIKLKVGFLVSNEDGIEKNIELLGFKPDVYSLHFPKVDEETVKYCRKNNIRLIPWTVNKLPAMEKLKALKVDGITTDFPDRAFKVFRRDKDFVNSKYDKRNDKNYELVWADEFNYSGEPDPKKWSFETGYFRNREAQYYTGRKENVRVENGNLVIEARKEKVKNKDFTSVEDKNWKTNKEFSKYTSASIVTKNKAEWQYAKIEVRAKLPKGRGAWSAIWMLGANYNEVGWAECGEIDIMENVGYEPNYIHGTVHTKAYNHTKGTQVGRKIEVAEPWNDYHIYAIEWTPEKIDFMVDGVIYNTFTNEHKTTAEWAFDQNFHLRINNAVGGNWGGIKGIDDESFPQRMYVDYVRVYQTKEKKK